MPVTITTERPVCESDAGRPVRDDAGSPDSNTLIKNIAGAYNTSQQTMECNPYSRYPVHINAMVFSLALPEPISCVIRNLSENGAMLSLQKPRQLSRLIHLSLGKGEKVIECEVRWRNFNRLIGVRFASNVSAESLRAILSAFAARSRAKAR